MTDQQEIPSRTFVQKLWRALFRMFGWKITGALPTLPQYVVVVAPHTSTWDFFVGFLASRSIDMGFPHFMIKDSMFRGPLSWVLHRLGGIPVNRSAPGGLIEQVVAQFRQHEHFIIAVTPEGTRKKVRYWKQGFYHIALQAKAAIVLASFDFQRKIVNFAPPFMPSGNLEEDLEIIRRFYADVIGLHPERQSEILFRPENA